MQTKDEDVHMIKRSQQKKKHYEYSSELCSDEDSNSDEYSSEKENNDGDKKSAAAKNYEERIQQVRAERIAFLKSLKIEEAKTDLKEATNAMKVKKKPTLKKIYERIPRSLRKSNNSLNYSEKAVLVDGIETETKVPHVTAYNNFKRDFWKKKRARKNMSKEDATSMNNLCSKTWKSMTDADKQPYFEKQLEAKLHSLQYVKQYERTIPPRLKFQDAIFEGLYTNYAQDVDICEPNSELGFIYDKSVLENLTLKKSHVTRIIPEKITTLAFYPSSESIILAAGSIYGNLGIWNAVSESRPYGFKIHLDSITHLAFNPFNPDELISSSLDGTLRCCDMKKHVVSEIYTLSDASSCTNFDFLAPKTYLIAQDNEEVVIIDTRTKRYECGKKHFCNEIIECVNIHPANKNIFLTGGGLGRICLWDLRNLQEQPVAEIINHEKYTQSAYFSPVSGNFILSSSSDSICISDCSNLTDIKLEKGMKYRGLQDPLSAFKATWLPYSEESFTVGSKEIPRKIQIYNKNFDVLHSVMHENVTCALYKNVFHPFKPFIVGSNISGKIFVFAN